MSQTGRAIVNGFFGTDFPFRNLIKNLGTWGMQSGTFAWPTIVNDKGYPTSAPPAVPLQAVIPVPPSFTGSLVLKWTGTSGFQLSRGNPGFTEVGTSGFVVGGTTSNLQVRGTNGRVVFTLNTWSGSSLTLQMLSGETVSSFDNLVLCRLADEAGLDAGDAFNPDFITALQSLNPVMIRIVDWHGINETTQGSNITAANYMAQDNYISYTARRFLQSTWVGTIGGTDTYTCSAATDTPVAWTDGETFQGQFTNANTITTPTIDCGSRGAKTIVTASGAALSVSAISAAKLATFVYSSILDKLLYYPGSTAGGLAPGVPVSVAVDLCNKLGCGLYHNLPLLLTDAAVTSVVGAAKGRLSAGLFYGVALCNELWNFGYAQTTLIKNFGAALGFTNSNGRQELGYAGLRHRQIMGLATAAWGGGTGLKRILEVQASGTSSSIKLYMLEGSDLASYGFNSSPNRPIDYTDWLAYAPYYHGAVTRDLDGNYNTTDLANLTGAADDYASLDATRMSSALNWLDNDVRAGLRGGVLGASTLSAHNTNAFVTWNTVASTIGYPDVKVIFYENAFQCLGPSTSRCTALGIDTAYGGLTGKIQNLIEAYKNDQLMLYLTHDHIQNFFGKSKSLYANWYTFGTNQQWSLRGTSLYSTPYKSWDALVLLNQGKRRIRVTT